jgi:hypothetical protein
VPIEARCTDAIRWGEDVKFADCVHLVFPHLAPDNTRDAHFREHFLLFEPEMHLRYLRWGSLEWLWKGKNRTLHGDLLQCCSSRPIVYHHFKTNALFWGADYFVHRLCVDPL